MRRPGILQLVKHRRGAGHVAASDVAADSRGVSTVPGLPLDAAHQDICHMLPRRRLTTLLALTSDVAALLQLQHSRAGRAHDTRPDTPSFLLSAEGSLLEIAPIRGHKRPRAPR